MDHDTVMDHGAVMDHDPVLVVGAGPTGLTLACALRSAGVPVRVVDAANGPASTSRALGLQPRGVEVLDRLGALADLPQRSLPINQVIVVVSGRELTRLRTGQQTRLGKYPGLLVSQAEIEGALRRRLAELGGEVQWGRRVIAADQGDTGGQGDTGDTGGVVVRFGDGTASRVGWLVGCDGAHSTVRKAAGIGFPGVPLLERFLIADVRADLDRPRDAVSVWLRGAEMLAAFPLPGKDLWRLMAPALAGEPADRELAAPDPAAPDPAAVLARMRARVADEIGREVRTAEWTSSFQIHRRLADTYCRDRILLAGDAAHIHSPFGGQGMNTGIGDAENLAWKLALVVTGRAGHRLIDTYQAERRPVAAEVLSTTSGVANLLYGDGAAARFLRDHVVIPVLGRPVVQRMIAERSSQLLVSYRGGPLARGSWWRSGSRPGDRVPDLPCHRAEGTAGAESSSEGTPECTPTRLHAELHGRWAVLAPARCALGELARAWLGDGVTELIADVREMMLVRPDGHLAWRGSDPAGLQKWLARALDRRMPTHIPVGSGRVER